MLSTWRERKRERRQSQRSRNAEEVLWETECRKKNRLWWEGLLLFVVWLLGESEIEGKPEGEKRGRTNGHTTENKRSRKQKKTTRSKWFRELSEREKKTVLWEWHCFFWPDNWGQEIFQGKGWNQRMKSEDEIKEGVRKMTPFLRRT